MNQLRFVPIVVALTLVGCAETRDDAAWQADCLEAGHTPGTAEFADCLAARQAEFEEECLSAVAACQ